MKKLILAACCISLLSSACTEFPAGQLQEVKIVGHEPSKEEGSGISYKLVYEHWIYENTKTGERFTLTEKFGNVGETIKIRR